MALDPGEREHRIGGGGFDPIIRAATAGEEVVTRPRDVVPGDDAEESAVAEVVVLFLIVDRPVKQLLSAADLTEADRQAFASAFERATREIPSVRGVRVGKRVMHGAGYEQTAPDAADFVAIIEFEDLPGLQEYLRHPAHEELGILFQKLLAGAMVYDFEMDGLENLAGLIGPD